MFEIVKSSFSLMDPHLFPKLVLLHTKNAHHTKYIGHLVNYNGKPASITLQQNPAIVYLGIDRTPYGVDDVMLSTRHFARCYGRRNS